MATVRLHILLLGIVFGNYMTSGCPKHQYNYNVVEIPEPSLRALGEFILKRMKVGRDEKQETCHNHNSIYLDAFKTTKEKFDAIRMAGIFWHQYQHDPSKIFHGAEATEQALKTACTYNLLILKDLSLRRFLLKNATDGEIFEGFYTEEELMIKIAHEEEWHNVDVLDCQHYLFHLSTTYGKSNITISIIDKADTQEELGFSTVSAVGGFYRDGCNKNSVEEICEEE